MTWETGRDNTLPVNWRTRTVSSFACATLLAIAILPAAAIAQSRGLVGQRDTGYYPTTAHPPDPHPVPPVTFKVLYKVALPGLPLAGEAGAPEPIRFAAGPNAAIVIAETRTGAYRIDARTGAILAAPDGPGASAGDPVTEPHAAPGTAAEPSPRWLENLATRSEVVGVVPGPGELCAVLLRGGAIEARVLDRGHQLWRSLAPQRIAKPGASWDGLLLITTEASREISTYRWSDGTEAGRFQLDSSEAYFVSGTLLAGDTLYALAFEPPRQEVQLLALGLAHAAVSSPTGAPAPMK